VRANCAAFGLMYFMKIPIATQSPLGRAKLIFRGGSHGPVPARQHRCRTSISLPFTGSFITVRFYPRQKCPLSFCTKTPQGLKQSFIGAAQRIELMLISVRVHSSSCFTGSFRKAAAADGNANGEFLLDKSMHDCNRCN